MEYTLTISGDIHEIRRAITILGADADGAPEGDSFGPDDFVMNLTESGRRAVEQVARPSALGGTVLRAHLIASMGLSSQELAGVFGGIGIHWGRASSHANPFRGKWDASARDFRYGIDRELANQILVALKVS